jgi:hypothetical protein
VEASGSVFCDSVKSSTAACDGEVRFDAGAEVMPVEAFSDMLSVASLSGVEECVFCDPALP